MELYAIWRRSAAAANSRPGFKAKMASPKTAAKRMAKPSANGVHSGPRRFQGPEGGKVDHRQASDGQRQGQNREHRLAQLQPQADFRHQRCCPQIQAKIPGQCLKVHAAYLAVSLPITMPSASAPATVAIGCSATVSSASSSIV
jgi:hypothetical protein